MVSEALQEFCRFYQPFADVLHAVDHEADANPDAAEFLAALEFVVAEPRSTIEKLDAMAQLTSLPPGREFTPDDLREFFGWISRTVQ